MEIFGPERMEVIGLRKLHDLDRIHLAHNINHWQVLVNAVMNYQVP
jgi:hypothetical protein